MEPAERRARELDLVLGGVIVDHFGWRWTFLIAVPPVIAIVLLAFRWMPAAATRDAKPIDMPGVVSLSIGVLAFVYALTELSQRTVAPNMLVVAVFLVIGIVATVTFVRREATAADPLVEMRLLRQKEFAYVNALNFLYGAGIFGLFTFIPLYAESAYGMSSSAAGALISEPSRAFPKDVTGGVLHLGFLFPAHVDRGARVAEIIARAIGEVLGAPMQVLGVHWPELASAGTGPAEIGRAHV